MKDNSRVQKECGFYINNMHFATMILPFVNKQLEENTKIITFFENDYTINIELVLSKLKISDEKKKALLNINWSNNKSIKYLSIDKYLNKEINKKRINLILINGNSNYINHIHMQIERFIQNNIRKDEKIKIIDFYEVGKFDENITEILNYHELLFNTAGEHKIEEIFHDYKRLKINI